jgi:division protein CdvB (Snf7/Vps24/ESCRT-III family)
LHITVSHRQHQLYTERGFDIARWESLVEEANALRKEIKGVANEYDVEWDEKKDETSEIVHQALSKERRKKVRVSSDEEEEEEEARPKKRD